MQVEGIGQSEPALPTAYPRLPPHLDRRRKLMPEDIESIRREYEGLTAVMTKRQAILTLARKYGVTYSTIYYWTHDDYRARKRVQNALAHNKYTNYDDYVRHRRREIQNRRERLKRYPPLRLYYAYMSAKSEKRCKRKTVLGFKMSS